MRRLIYVVALAAVGGTAWGQASPSSTAPGLGSDDVQEKIIEQAENWKGLTLDGKDFVIQSLNPGPKMVVAITNNGLSAVIAVSAQEGQNATIQFDDGYSLPLGAERGLFRANINAAMMPAFIHAFTASKALIFQQGNNETAISLAGTSYAIDAMSFFTKEHDISLPPPFVPAKVIIVPGGSNPDASGNATVVSGDMEAVSSTKVSNENDSQPASSEAGPSISPNAPPRTSETDTPAPTAPLKIIAVTCEETVSGPEVQGEIQNTSSNSFGQIEIDEVFHDSKGNFISSNTAFLKFNPLLPQQTSTFDSYGSNNPVITSVQIAPGIQLGGAIPFFGQSEVPCN